MKKIIGWASLLLVLAFSLNAQEDTMYILKNGGILAKFNINTQIDSILFYNPFEVHFDSFIDSRDGQKYKFVAIGSTKWMSENLKYLPGITSPATSSTTTPCYYVYGYYGLSVFDAQQTDNFKTYGVLYNWPAVMAGSVSSSSNPSGVTGVCPAGWHLPSDAEWIALTDYLGGVSVAGGRLKETGTLHWSYPNSDATNTTGFTALPGGNLGNGGFFSEMGSYGYWWSATDFDATLAISRYLYYFNGSMNNGYLHEKKSGFSVRCVKD